MSTLTLTLTEAQREFIEAEVARTGQGGPVDHVRSLIEKERERAERLEFEESLREAMREPGIPMTSQEWDEIEAEAMRLIAENKPS